MGGEAPSDVEVRMFIVLTISLCLMGLIMGAFGEEFLGVHSTFTTPAVSSLDRMAYTIGGMFAMFIPIIGLFWLPAWLLVIVTIIQLIWFYLLYAIAVRPFIPSWV